VPSSLSTIPARKRRTAAATLGLLAALLTAVGAVAATGASSTSLQVFVAVTLFVALLLGLLAWGFAYSVRLDESEQSLDDAIMDVVSSRPASLCDCGHDHDPTELHVTDAEPAAACRHDGGGAACAHDCETCALASLRPSPTTPRAERLSR
jgi:hypothetical protein